MKHLNLGVLASGGGTNLQAIIDNCQKGAIDADVGVVISNSSSSGALERSRKHGIPALHISGTKLDSDDVADETILHALADHNVDLVVLAGYMKLIGTKVLGAYRNRILNIHPALLPSFGGKGLYGRRVHEEVIESGVKVSGVTVHIVDEEYDHGPIVAQRPVPVLDEDSPDDLGERVLNEEHKLYSKVIQLFAEGRIRVQGRKVKITER